MCTRKTKQFLNFLSQHTAVPASCNFVAGFRISATFNTKKVQDVTKATFFKCSPYYQNIYNTFKGSYRNILKPLADVDSFRAY